MRSKSILQSVIIILCYCVGIVFLPNFYLYVEFRGFIFPALISIILTLVNFKTVTGNYDYFMKLLVFVVLGYILRFLVFFAFNGYFDVDFRYIKNDWYLLYVIMQIPTIILTSFVTFESLKIISKKKHNSLRNSKADS